MPDRSEKGLHEIAHSEPAISGSEGDQTALPVAAEPTVPAGTSIVLADQRHLGAALRDFIDVRSAAVSAIAVAAFHDAQENKASLTEELRDLRAEVQAAKDKYHEERETRIAAEARVREAERFRPLQQGTLALGSVVAGTGLPHILQEASVWNLGGFLAAIGLALIWISLSSLRTEPSK